MWERSFLFVEQKCDEIFPTVPIAVRVGVFGKLERVREGEGLLLDRISVSGVLKWGFLVGGFMDVLAGVIIPTITAVYKNLNCYRTQTSILGFWISETDIKENKKEKRRKESFMNCLRRSE